MNPFRLHNFRQKSIVQASYLIPAIFVGFFSVAYEKLMHLASSLHHSTLAGFGHYAYILYFFTFFIGTFIVIKFAPKASGSGIPQSIRALSLSYSNHQFAFKEGLVTLKTALIKTLSTLFAIFSGASVGREGPTVQIGASIFSFFGKITKEKIPSVDFHTYIVAGAAAGVSAAFNTPIAGITFALEELSENAFASLKSHVMAAVIIAGITAQAFLGDYVYFGTPKVLKPEIGLFFPSILIGMLGGFLGAIFSKLMITPTKALKKVFWLKKFLFFSLIVLIINFFTDSKLTGTGYEITKNFMESGSSFPIWFAPLKAIQTLLSFHTGIAGGIFSPTLSIGAALGELSSSTTNLFFSLDPKTAALLGMVSYFTGVVGAPLTAVIIITEMTDVHELIIPFLIAAFVAQSTSKAIQPVSLYKALSKNFE